MLSMKNMELSIWINILGTNRTKLNFILFCFLSSFVAQDLCFASKSHCWIIHDSSFTVDYNNPFRNHVELDWHRLCDSGQWSHLLRMTEVT